MNLRPVSSLQRNVRMAVRNFLLIATREELIQELKISQDRGDMWRAACVQEIIDEIDQAKVNSRGELPV